MKEEKASVLYIDDEISNLTGFKASFRKHYNVFTATTSTEGMEILENNKIHIIITDQRMPGVTGVEFLESTIKNYPDVIKMMLSGYADIEAVVNAVNKGHIYRYISKPWNEQELKMAIDNAYETYRTRNSLEEKTQELEKACQELNRFAYSASHELRAPLTTIQGIINLAKIENHYETDEYLQMIEKTLKKLDSFTKNIINYYKNTKKDDQLKSIDLKSHIEGLIENIKLFYNTSTVTFKIHVNQEEEFCNDEFRIGLILNNIISNAINHRSENVENLLIEIDVQVKNKLAEIKIKDNGNGIPPEHLDNIFKMFYRASNETTGSGLGLYIVKEAIDKINGTILVSSTIGEGTCFNVTIPSKNVEG